MEKKGLEFKTKSQLVYETIKNEIISGSLTPGIRVSAVEISHRLGVSRTPVNDAVKILADQGLVKILPNVGFEIMVLAWEDIKELIYLKGQIEKRTIKLVLERDQVIKLDKLRELLTKINTAITNGDSEVYYKLTKEFHFGFIRLSNGNILSNIYQNLWDYESWYARCLENKKEDLFLIIESHKKLLDAVEACELELAFRISDEHVEQCTMLVYKNMKSLGML